MSYRKIEIFTQCYIHFSLVNPENLPGLIFEILILIRRVVAWMYLRSISSFPIRFKSVKLAFENWGDRRVFFGVTSNAVTRKDAGASRKVSEWGEEEIVGRKGARRRWRRARRMRQRCRERRTKKNKPGYTATKVACGWAGAVIG